ncbi:hypothetical protein AB0F77_12200 [Streptomyces sp. NPDC026672]|uniref:hypothetical protein n=1 Tax=unclassified Streptomyces TaxID=2593676 RepID=UPI0033C84A99
MGTRSWGHRERLLALGAFGVLLLVCGAVATAAGATAGPGLAATGLVLACWEALALWAFHAYRGRAR